MFDANHAVRRASVMEARGQVAKHIDRYWLCPLQILRGGRLHKESASFQNCQLPVPLQESDAGTGQRALGTRLLFASLIGLSSSRHKAVLNTARSLSKVSKLEPF